MFTFRESTILNSRQQTLHTVSYVPKTSPIANVVWHHGYGEHIGRAGYKRAFEKMASSGVAVYSFDAHGHGRSEPKEARDRAVVWRFTDLVDDLYLVVDQVRQQPGSDHAPMFLAGHSMGGLVACHAALARQSMWCGLILTSALVDVHWTTVLRMQAQVGALLSAVIPRARIVAAVRPEDMSTDPQVVQDYISDPLNTVGPVSVRTSSQLLHAFRQLDGLKSQLRLPIYAVHGTCDHCTSLPAVEKLMDGVSSSDKTLKKYEGSYHELLQGPECEDCIHNIINWVVQHSPVVSKL